MRILSVHSTYIRYRATRKTPVAEPIDRKEDRMEDCVVLFCSVEKLDEINPALVVAGAKKGVLKRLGPLKVNRVMIFPYAHLTSTLSAPAVALGILTALERELRDASVEVKRAPFGWYKEFEMKSKGHPLADLSMAICPYEGRECDFECPYCHNPIRVSDVDSGNASVCGCESCSGAGSERQGDAKLPGDDLALTKPQIRSG